MGIGTDDNSKMVCHLIANGLGTPVKSKGNHLERDIRIRQQILNNESFVKRKLFVCASHKIFLLFSTFLAHIPCAIIIKRNFH